MSLRAVHMRGAETTPKGCTQESKIHPTNGLHVTKDTFNVIPSEAQWVVVVVSGGERWPP